MIGLPILLGGASGTLLQSTVATGDRLATQSLGEEGLARIDAPAGSGTVTVADFELALTQALPVGSELVRCVRGAATITTATHGSQPDRPVWEYPPSKMAALGPAPMGAGSWPADAGQIAISRALATELEVSEGDHVTVTAAATGNAADLVVTGIMDPAGAGPDVVAPLGSVLPSPSMIDGSNNIAPTWYVLGKPLQVEGAEGIEALGSTVTTRANIEASAANSADGATLATGTLAMVVVIAALAESVLIIGPAFAIGTRRNERELALLAACGAEPRVLRRVVLLRGVVLGVAASLAATVLAVAVAALVRWAARAAGSSAFPDLRIPVALLCVLGVFGTATAAASATLPARRAARMDSVAVLAGRRAEATERPGVGIAGLVTSAAGALAALAGSTAKWTPLAVVGVISLLIGTVTATPALIVLASRMAPRLSFAWRYALRDAARQRKRTGPAVAAIVAALSALTSVVAYQHALDQQRHAQYGSIGSPRTVAVGVRPPAVGPVDASRFDAQAAIDALQRTLTIDAVAPVSIAVPQPADWPIVGAGPDDPDTRWPTVSVVRPDAQQCTSGDLRDPLCGNHQAGATAWAASGIGPFVVVDDGTAMRMLNTSEAARAADALARGLAVVPSQYDLHPDGSTVRVSVAPGGIADARPTVTVDIAAIAADLGNDDQFALVLPPEAAQRLGLRTELVGLVARATGPLDTAAEAAARLALAEGADTVSLYVERGYRSEWDKLSLLLLVGALLAGAGVTGIAVALAASEARPDLATLAAVGAAPRTRRRIAAAQAGVLSFVGTAAGVLAGLVLARVLVFATWGGSPSAAPWVPWPVILTVALGVPVLASSGGWLLSRSQLPMIRRLAQ